MLKNEAKLGISVDESQLLWLQTTKLGKNRLPGEAPNIIEVVKK